MKGRKTERTIEFSGLTRHDNVQMTSRASSIAGIDPDDPPEKSFSQAIRELKTAESESVAWRLPKQAASRFDDYAFNEQTPDDTTAHRVDELTVFIETDRFQSLYSPEVIREWVAGDYHEEIDTGGGSVESIRPTDALWHVPTSDYAITNPQPVYEPLEQAIREHELNDKMFGEIRLSKRGGEVHMDILFDAFKVEFGSDADEDDGPLEGPVVLGIRTGYDFFGTTKVYAEGFAQQTSCNNSIRGITEKKSRRSVGTATSDTREWWDGILSEMDLMTDHLAEAIEEASGIHVDYMDMNFAQPFDHSDDLVALYELAGFPSYLAHHAASHATSRAEDQFEPTMWDIHSGATYALTHEYRGSENSSRMESLVDITEDMVLNPPLFVDSVSRALSSELSSDDGDDQSALARESASANVTKFNQSLDERREEFETRQETMRTQITDSTR